MTNLLLMMTKRSWDHASGAKTLAGIVGFLLYAIVQLVNQQPIDAVEASPFFALMGIGAADKVRKAAKAD